ncbi:MAG: c-type cytochrome [Paracoccaceae bacterium]
MHKLLIAAATLGLVAACNTEPQTPSAEMFFADNCTACHGATGRGDGPAAAGADPAVPDLTRISARSGGSFPKVAVMNQIDGYSRAGHGMMPEFGDILLGETMVIDTGDGLMTPAPVRLVALTAYIESLQQP